jgi:hypothetical protein
MQIIVLCLIIKFVGAYMPELCRFHGIIISMLFKDIAQHNKPHIHVSYGEHTASFGIDGELLSGTLPVKQFKLLQAWLVLHEEELYITWNKAVQGQPFEKLPPL